MRRLRSCSIVFRGPGEGAGVLDCEIRPRLVFFVPKICENISKKKTIFQRLYMAVSSKKTLEQMKVIWKKGSDPFACKRKRELYYQ